MVTVDSPTSNGPSRTQASDSEPLLDSSDTFPSDLSSIPKISVKSCAVGTVPVVRKELKDLTRFSSLNAYLNSIKAVPRSPGSGGFYHAAVEDEDSIHALSANLNHQLPRIGTLGDHSTLQLWIAGTTRYNGGPLNTLEMGLDVDPATYGGESITNYYVHTFVEFSSYNYTYFCNVGQSGHDCTGSQYPTYHQQSNVYYPNQSWTPQAGGPYNCVSMGILSGSAGSSPVWCFVVQDQIMGWMYKSQMPVNGLTNDGVVAKVYGEVYTASGQATTTTIGSGYWPWAMFPYTAWAGNLSIFRAADNYWTDFRLQGDTPCFTDDRNCYEVAARDTSSNGGPCWGYNGEEYLGPNAAPWGGWGTFMFYGGPGAYTGHYPTRTCY